MRCIKKHGSFRQFNRLSNTVYLTRQPCKIGVIRFPSFKLNLWLNNVLLTYLLAFAFVVASCGWAWVLGNSIAYIAVYTLIMDNDILASMIESWMPFLFFFEEFSYSYSSSGYSFALFPNF